MSILDARPQSTSSPSSGTASDPGRVTPMMAQYLEIKAANPDCLLFYRMGDFYELFFEDAEIASRALGIVLTKRGKHQGEDIPMCGVPIERADDYLQRLIALGHPRRRLRADGRPGRSAQARRQVGRPPRRRAPRHARHDHRGTPARCPAAPISCCALQPRAGRSARDAGRYGARRRSISPRARSTVCEDAAAGLAGEIARLEPRRSSSPDALIDDADAGALLSEIRRAGHAGAARDALRQASAERRADGLLRRRDARRLRRVLARRTRRRGALPSPISSARRSARARRCARPQRWRAARRWRSMRRRAPIWNSRARSPASARHRCSLRSICTVTPAGARLLPSGLRRR